MARRKSKKKMKKLIGIIIALILAFFAYEAKDVITENVDVSEFAKGDAVYVHFIDVGQGSSTLIQQGTSGILIDAGEKDYGQVVVDYLNEVGVTSLEYVVASHPHSDHIGGLDEVLYAFPVDEIVLPELSYDNTPTTRVFEDLLIAIDENNIPATFTLAENHGMWMTDDVSISTIGPEKQDDNLNNMSVTCYVGCYNTIFAILGDAEKDELKDIYNGNYSLEADIIALGHHGSSTSIYKPYLDAVNADVAVISCGAGNSYGHPHKEALDYIAENNMNSLRTDEMGDIVFKVTADGYSLVE
ncbi:MAG: MBL fold metallo-hydrolase [Clostridia bacterium]|nr:MBL fold metallo-hydrolase [Clostridia bacterium]